MTASSLRLDVLAQGPNQCGVFEHGVVVVEPAVTPESASPRPGLLERAARELGYGADAPPPGSVASARAAQLAERAAVERETGAIITDDGIPVLGCGQDVGVLIANAIAVACYGPCGELRK